MSHPRHLVIGAGEVGTALAEVLDCPIRDIEPGDTWRRGYDIIHVAFPWSGAFTSCVDDYVTAHDAAYVVVHSTVPPGICDTYGWNFSPVTGRHPDLTSSLLAFEKPVAGPHADLIVEELVQAGIPAVVAECTSTELEVAKLVDLIVYGANIRIAKEVERYCRKHGLDYDQVFRESARRYNAGYASLADPRFRRYDVAHIPGALGGHCVGYPNLGLLDDERLEALVRPVTKEGWDDALD